MFSVIRELQTLKQIGDLDFPLNYLAQHSGPREGPGPPEPHEEPAWRSRSEDLEATAARSGFNSRSLEVLGRRGRRPDRSVTTANRELFL